MKKRLSPASGVRQAGFALLEVLVSLLLFSFGVLGLVGLQARAIGLSTDAEDRNRAALLASDIASAMWLGKSVSVDTSASSVWQKRVGDTAKGGLPNGAVAVTAVGANGADIQITWKAPSRTGTSEQSSTLTTRVTLP
ncbi:type IV pilus modification protein PilV [Variovorax paradoxus]|nr:type IV pilus modification protein PilV [Variovorax paradoxus]